MWTCALSDKSPIVPAFLAGLPHLILAHCLSVLHGPENISWVSLPHNLGSCLLLVIYHFGIYSDVLLLSLMRPHTFPRRHRHREEEPTFIATQTPDVLSRLLPDTITLDLDTCDVDDTAAQITLAVRSTQAMALC